MESYEKEFKELFPEESISLRQIKEKEPYNSDYWKKYNIDEEQIVEKKVECSKDDVGAFSKITNGTVTIDSGLTIEKEIVKYYKKASVKKKMEQTQGL